MTDMALQSEPAEPLPAQPEPAEPIPAESKPEPTASGPEPVPSQPETTSARSETTDMAVTAIRRAEPLDIPALTRTLVRAYMNDPVAIWICRSEGLRARTLAAMYSVRLHQMLVHRGIWTNSQRSSVAVWLPPGSHKPALRPSTALLRCLADPRLLTRAPLLAHGLRGMDRLHPQGPPHWYLSLLGTDPDAQGHGWGSAVLEPALEQCDVEGVGAYLESSKPRNLDFYARFGFQVTGELRLPSAGPTMWPMWRAPRNMG